MPEKGRFLGHTPHNGEPFAARIIGLFQERHAPLKHSVAREASKKSFERNLKLFELKEKGLCVSNF